MCVCYVCNAVCGTVRIKRVIISLRGAVVKLIWTYEMFGFRGRKERELAIKLMVTSVAGCGWGLRVY